MESASQNLALETKRRRKDEDRGLAGGSGNSFEPEMYDPENDTKLTYKSEIGSGEHGFLYQRHLAYVILLRLIRLGYEFKFYYEFADADKFDDVAFYNKKTKQWIFLQVKHSDTENTIIDHNKIFPEEKRHEGAFSVFKYVKSSMIAHRKIKGKKSLILFTNQKLDNPEKLSRYVSIENRAVDEVLQMSLDGTGHHGLKPTEYACQQIEEYINKEFLELKDAIKTLFSKGIVSDILIDYKTPLGKVLCQTKINALKFSESFNNYNENTGLVELHRLIKYELDVEKAIAFPKKELFKQWPPLDENFLLLKDAIVELFKNGTVVGILKEYKTAMMKIIEKAGTKLCFKKSFIKYSELCTMLEGQLNELGKLNVTPEKMFLDGKKSKFESLPANDVDFIGLKDAIVELFNDGKVGSILMDYKIPLCKILEKAEGNKLKFKETFIASAAFCKQLETKLGNLSNIEFTPKENLIDGGRSAFKNLPKNEEDATQLITHIEELYNKGVVTDLMKDYKSAMKNVLEIVKGNECYRFKNSFYESYEFWKISENLGQVETKPEKMFLEKSLPEEGEELDALTTAISDLFTKGIVSDILKIYNTELMDIIEKSKDKFKFTQLFIDNNRLFSSLKDELQDLSIIETSPKENLLDGKESKFKNLPKNETDFQLFKSDLKVLFENGTVSTILKNHKTALYHILHKIGKGDRLKFKQTFIASNKLYTEIEAKLGNLDQVSISTKETLISDSLPTESNQIESLKKALELLFKTGAVSDILREYKKPLAKLLETSADGEKLRFKTSLGENIVLCKMLEIELGNLSEAVVTPAEKLFDGKNSKFTNLPSADVAFANLSNSIRNLLKTGAVDEMLLKYQTPLSEIFIANTDGTIVCTGDFNEQHKNKSVSLLYQMLKTDEIDEFTSFLPKKPMVRQFPVLQDKDITLLKNSLTNFFKTGIVDEVLIDYQIALKAVLTPCSCYEIRFADTFTSDGTEYNVALLYNHLSDDELVGSFKKDTKVYIEKAIFDENTSRKNFLPFYMDRKDIDSFFEHFTLSNQQPHNLYSYFVDELYLHLKTWMRTDVFGNLSEDDDRMAVDTFEEHFKNTMGATKNEKNVLDEKSLNGFFTVLQQKFESRYPELMNHQKIYVNREVFYHNLAESVDKMSDVTSNNQDQSNPIPTVDVNLLSLLELQKTNLQTFKTSLITNDASPIAGIPKNKINKLLISFINVLLNSSKNVGSNLVLEFLQKVNYRVPNIYSPNKTTDDQLAIDLINKFEDQQCFLLTSGPGTGKTKLLQYVSYKMQNLENGSVFLIHLNRLSSKMQNVKADRLLDILENVLSSKSISHIEDVIHLRKNDRITIFFDAFDEIRTDDNEIIIELFVHLLQSKNVRIFISGRKHIEEKLTETFKKNNLSLIKLSVVPLDSQHQKDTLKRAWNVSKVREQLFDIYSDVLLMNQYINIPLSIQMLADIFEQEFEEFCGKSKDDQIIELNKLKKDTYKQVQIYDLFLKKNISHALTDPSIQDYFESHLMLAIETLDIKELKDLFRNSGDKKSYRMFLKRCYSNTEKSLLIEIVNKEVKFTHRSYAEFMIAKYLSNKLNDNKLRIFDILSKNYNIKLFTMMMIEQDFIFSKANEDSQTHLIEDIFLKHNKIAFYACDSNCFELVRMFLQKYLDKLKNYEEYNQMLQVAIENGCVEICSLLIQNYGFNVNFLLSNGDSLIHLAIEEGHMDIVELLLRNEAKLDMPNSEGLLPLHIAVTKNKNLVNLLLTNGADVHAKDRRQMTPLHIAAIQGKVQIMKILIAEEAIIDALDEENLTPLHYASAERHNEAVVLLIENGADIQKQATDGTTPLHFAARNGAVEVINTLIAKGAIIDTPNEPNITPLHFACAGGNNEAVVQLIDNGADIQKQAIGGIIPLHVAAYKGAVEVIQTLIDKKAVVDTPNEANLTPLHFACAGGNNEAVVLLIDNGADIEKQTNDGSIPLHFAASQGAVEVIQTLIAKKAIIDTPNEDRCTPLHIASGGGHNEAVVLLIDNGADIEKQAINGSTPLHMAACAGAVEVIKTLIAKKAIIHALDKYNNTPLHSASAGGHNEAAVLLIGNGADIQKQTKEGDTPLHLAARKGAVEVIKTLIAKKAIIDALNKNICTPLHGASGGGHNEAAILLISNGADIQRQAINGSTPLHLAAYKGAVEVVKTLIAKEAKIDAMDNDNRTPLHYASFKGHNDVAALLIDYGADIKRQNKHGCTPLHLAAREGAVEVIKTLIAKGAIIDALNEVNRTPLHCAAAEGHNEAVVLLIDNGADIQKQNKHGCTPLHLAAQEGAVEVIKTLITKEAIIDALAENNGTPLHCASVKGHNEAVILLIQSGAGVKRRMTNGFTPLHWAMQTEKVNLEVIKTLIANGAIIDDQDNANMTPLHHAIENGHIEAVLLLIEKGANIKQKSKNGQSPLHITAANGNVEILSILLAKGAKVNSKDEKNWTPLHYASANGHNEAVAFLLDNGALIERKSEDGHTPLHVAAMEGMVETLSTLIARGANLGVRDHAGCTPLTIASQEGHKAVIEVLIEKGADSRNSSQPSRSTETSVCSRICWLLFIIFLIIGLILSRITILAYFFKST